MPETKFDADKFEAQVKSFNGAIEAVEKSVELLGTEKANADDLANAKAEIQELKDNLGTLEMVGDEKLIDYVKKSNDHANQLEERLHDLENTKGFKLEKNAKQIEELVKDEDFMKALAKKDKTFEATLKADVTTSSFTADSGAVAMDQLTIPGVEKHPWRMNPVFAAIPKRMVGEKVHTITWYDENTRVDSAAAVAEGGTYAQSSTSLIKRLESFYKAGHYTTLTEETLEDSDLMMGEVTDLLTSGLGRERERQLLLGAGSGSNEVTGVINTTAQVAKDFALQTGFDVVSNPNHYDVLRAAKLQVRVGIGSSDTAKMGYNANMALVNPADLANLDLQKDPVGGGYILPPFLDNAGNRVSGMLLMESDDITAGKFLVGDWNAAQLFIKRNILINTSENVASNFLADKIVLKASLRMALKITSFKAYAFVYGDFDTAKGLISGS